ncbi:hypothetical protein LBMAG42_38230 [Deltaproteobacteria bacterium]|nr:hypothetical protein LBMAG42_38230 [Deltaproteobacteria bacterium]
MLPVLLIAALASAAEYKPSGKATVSGVSELTLYAPPVSHEAGWYVQAKVGEEALLLRLGSGGRGEDGYGVRLTPGAAKRIGVKVTGKEGKETAQVSGLTLGTVTIATKAGVGPIGHPSDVDGIIDVAGYPELAWAIEPAAGKVKVGPTGSGNVAEAIGAGRPYTQSAKFKQKIGKDKATIWAKTLTGEATVSGVTLPASYSLDGNSAVAAEVDGGADWYEVAGVPNPTWPLPGVEGLRIGEREVEWREIAVAGTPVWAPVLRAGAGLSYRFSLPAQVGFNVLSRFDVGIDAGAHTIALRPSAGGPRASYVEIAEATLRAKLDKPPAEGADADATRTASAAAIAPLVKFYNGVGKYSQGVETGKRWTELEPERCTSWHAYGAALVGEGKVAAAKEPLRKAAELYQAWAVRPLAERTELAGSEAKRSKAPGFDGVWSQPHSCFTAWSGLAEALVANGEYAAVAEIYPKYADLDSTLPLVAGNALLLQGNPAGAEAAYRQALQLSYTDNGFARGGMMLATRSRSLDLALAQFEGVVDEEQWTLRFFLVYGELLRQKGGSAASEAGLAAFLGKTPWSIPGWLALANEQVAAGHSNADALAKAQALLATRLATTPDVGAAHAWNAEALRLSGKLAEAATEAERAQALDPSNPLGLFVLARVAESAGDAPRAAALRLRAGQAGAWDPFYASLLATTPG